MNYRITQEFKPPFRINTLIEEAGQLKVLCLFHLLSVYQLALDIQIFILIVKTREVFNFLLIRVGSFMVISFK